MGTRLTVVWLLSLAAWILVHMVVAKAAAKWRLRPAVRVALPALLAIGLGAVLDFWAVPAMDRMYTALGISGLPFGELLCAMPRGLISLLCAGMSIALLIPLRPDNWKRRQAILCIGVAVAWIGVGVILASPFVLADWSVV